MRFVGQQCIQLHGGIGVTDECRASHYFKRLTMLEMSLGDTLHHLGEVSARMQDTAEGFGQPIRQIFAPVYEIEMPEPTALGAEFVRWEIATAVAGAPVVVAAHHVQLAVEQWD